MADAQPTIVIQGTLRQRVRWWIARKLVLTGLRAYGINPASVVMFSGDWTPEAAATWAGTAWRTVPGRPNGGLAVIYWDGEQELDKASEGEA